MSGSSTEDLVIEDVSFKAEDGFPLAGTLFTQPGPVDGPLALISSAAAVPRAFYRRFAGHLVKRHGFRAVLTYDYRGVSQSAPPRDWSAPLLMSDWAERDLPAAQDRLNAAAPGAPMVGVGQSFGAQALGLSGRHRRFARYLMVAAMSGHWRLTAEPLKVFSSMNLIGVPLAMLTGRVPGWAGLGSSLPGSVFRQWARWGRNRDYFFADEKMNAEERFAEVETPILALGMTDDPWATEKAKIALLRYYSGAPVTISWLSPETGGAPIGHLGFFRQRFAETLWPVAIDWLKHGRAPD